MMIAIRWLLVSCLLTATWAPPVNGYFQTKVEVPIPSYGLGRPEPTRVPIRYTGYPSHNHGQNPPAYEGQYRLPYSSTQYVQYPTMNTNTNTRVKQRPIVSYAQVPAYQASGTGKMQNSFVAQGYQVRQPSFDHRPWLYLQYNPYVKPMMTFPGYPHSTLFGMQNKRNKIVNRVINNNMNINTGTQGVVGRRKQNNSLGSQANETTVDQDIFSGGTVTSDSITAEELSSKNSTELVTFGIDTSLVRESSGEPGAETGSQTQEDERTVSEQEKADRYNQLLREYKKFLEQSGKNDVLITGMKETQGAEAYFENEQNFVENTYYTNFSETSVDRTFTEENIEAKKEMPFYF